MGVRASGEPEVTALWHRDGAAFSVQVLFPSGMERPGVLVTVEPTSYR